METITLPYWMFIVLLVFAGIMVLDRILLPGMRWYLKRRVNRVIEEINSRLDIEIRPIQFTRRQALIDQLVFDEKVIDAIKSYAQERDMPQAVAQEKARRRCRDRAGIQCLYLLSDRLLAGKKTGAAGVSCARRLL